MNCPDLDALAGTLTGELEQHMRDCAACRAARDLCAVRAVATDGAEACERAELLLAMREDGVLGDRDRDELDAHLAMCPRCGGFGDAPAGSSTLPTIDPAAYSLGPEIARGGMGRIRSAHDRRIGRPVVVKELLAGSPALTARFAREARVTARLQHPGIVPIYEIGAWPDGTPFYVMRRVVGRTLREALAAAPLLSARLALLPALVTAAEAVAFAHDQGVVHRDLTPANIVVGDYGDTIVIDWGLAKQLGEASERDDADAADPAASSDAADVDPELTRAGDVLGTAAYMPPEQATGAEVDRRADVYALGALLHHLLAGAPPHLGTSAEILAQLRDGSPLAASPDLAIAPRDLVSIARKAMSRDPSDRYPHAGALVAELRRFTAGQVVAAHRYSLGESVRMWMRRHVVLATTLVAGLIAGAISVIAILQARDNALEERRRAEALLATLRVDDAIRQHGAGHTWVAALELVDGLRLGADTPAIRRDLAELMRGIDPIAIHTPHHPLRLYGGLPAEYAAITGAAFSPDGEQLVVSTYDGFDIYATADGRHLVSGTRPGGWADPTAVVTGDRVAGRVRYTPDGRFLVNEDEPPARRAGVWDASTGKLVAARMAPIGRAFTADRSSDGMLAELEPSSADAPLEALDLARGTVVTPSVDVMTLDAPHGLLPTYDDDDEGFTGDLAAAARAGRWDLSLDQRTVATMAHGQVQIWDATTGQRRQTFAVGDAQSIIFVDHDRRLLLESGAIESSTRPAARSRIGLRDVASGELQEELVGKAVALSEDRLRLAIQPVGRGVVVVTLDRDPALARFDRAGHCLVRTLAVDARGQTLVGVMADGSLRAFDVMTGRAWPLPPLREPAALARGGSRLIATRDDGELVVVDIATGAVVRTVVLPPGAPVRTVALDRTGEVALVTHGDFTATRTLVSSGASVRINHVLVESRVEGFVLACHRTGGRARYDLQTSAEDEVDPSPQGCATAPDDADLVAYKLLPLPDNEHETGSSLHTDGYTIRLLGWRTSVLTPPSPPVAIDVTDDFIATGTSTWTRWGAELYPLRHLDAPEREVWFSPDHQRLVVIDAEGNVSVWDMRLETRTADELAAQLRARLGLVFENGQIYSDEPADEVEAWQKATRSGSRRSWPHLH